ncbi:O-antigen translocase [Pedobacter antarcticus]|uniref:O-antigen translocase n=1 Tax=Pedobacter antarcticus TaxID=34086 RepID=UPI00088A94C9|nr:O-antigen translocase [Pedobacter antarcticus]SDM17707.1 polysaccharide transporter, PST family [Pedobacter antarcticus]
MKLIKTSLFSGIITFIKIASGFIAAKVIAMITGPAGVALLGQFTSFLAIILTVSNGAISNGVVKYTAEYEGDGERLKTLFSTSLRISLIAAIFTGIIILCLAPYLSEIILYSRIYANVFRTLALTLLFYAVNILFISILNGRKEIKLYTFVNTLGAIFSLVLTVILVYFFRIEGALYALIVTQTLSLLVTVLVIRRQSWFNRAYFGKIIDIPLAKQLGGYGLIALVSALTMPVSQILLRNMLTEKLGVDSAGYWQGMMRVSDGYLLLINTSISIYYLPKLSSLKNEIDIRKEILYGFKIILPVTIFGCLIIYFLRFFIIKTLYTPEFLAMEDLFVYQLLGDVMKVASLILGYLLVAKAMFKTAMFTETFFAVMWVVFGYLFVDMFGLKGVTIAFFANYIIYFLIMVYIFRHILFGKLEEV